MEERKTQLSPEQYKKAQEDPDTKREYNHEVTGLKYYLIKLTGPDGEPVEIRLFESLVRRRLKLEEETFQEYTIRRHHIKKAMVSHREGQVVWQPQWGSVNQANALRVSTELNQKKNPTPMPKQPKGLPRKERMRLKLLADREANKK